MGVKLLDESLALRLQKETHSGQLRFHKKLCYGRKTSKAIASIAE